MSVSLTSYLKLIGGMFRGILCPLSHVH